VSTTIRDYEALWIVDANLTDEELTPVMTRFRELVEANGGQIESFSTWGERRRLAYEVKGRREGTYILMSFKGEPAVEKELDRVLRLTEQVLRHMIVKLEPNEVEAARAEREREKARLERAAAQAAAEAAAPAEEAAPEAEAGAAPAEETAPVAEAASAEEAPAAAEEAPAEAPAEEA
jgi:small subunit ribosomal protein S6